MIDKFQQLIKIFLIYKDTVKTLEASPLAKHQFSFYSSPLFRPTPQEQQFRRLSGASIISKSLE